MKVKLTTLRPKLRVFDARAVKPELKTVDPFYLTPEYKKWRETVIARAGRRCEDVDGDERCPKAEPQHRMFADHIKERRDGGAPFDPANGKCRCGSHHTLKTANERAKRLRR